MKGKWRGEKKNRPDNFAPSPRKSGALRWGTLPWPPDSNLHNPIEGLQSSGSWLGEG